MWVLIIILSNAVTSTEFSSQKQCDVARVEVGNNPRVFTTYCFKK